MSLSCSLELFYCRLCRMTSMRHQSSVWVDQHPQRLDTEKRIRDFWVHMGRAHRAIDLSPTRPPSFCILCTKPSPQTSQSSVMWSQAGCSLVVQNISSPLSFACPNPVLETQDPPALGFIEDLHLLTTTSGAPKGLLWQLGANIYIREPWTCGDHPIQVATLLAQEVQHRKRWVQTGWSHVQSNTWIQDSHL